LSLFIFNFLPIIYFYCVLTDLITFDISFKNPNFWEILLVLLLPFGVFTFYRLYHAILIFCFNKKWEWFYEENELRIILRDQRKMEYIKNLRGQICAVAIYTAPFIIFKIISYSA
jgi:hypothetical protein